MDLPQYGKKNSMTVHFHTFHCTSDRFFRHAIFLDILGPYLSNEPAIAFIILTWLQTWKGTLFCVGLSFLVWLVKVRTKIEAQGRRGLQSDRDEAPAFSE